jgi:hypothetical protein
VRGACIRLQAWAVLQCCRRQWFEAMTAAGQQHRSSSSSSRGEDFLQRGLGLWESAAPLTPPNTTCTGCWPLLV